MFGSGNGLATDWWQAITWFLSLYGVTRPQWVNSWWPSDAKWQHRPGLPLAQVMAHFLMTPSHYLNQCSLIISGVLWPSTESDRVSQEILKITILDMNLKINNLRLQPHLPCANDLRYFWPADRGRQSSLDVWRPMLWAHNMNHFNNLSLWCLVVTC